jgi:hypothetical protein
MSIKINYKILNEQQKEVTFLKEEEIIVGRPKKDSIPTIDFTPDNRVSRPHLAIYYKYNTWWIEDIESKNGTFLNDQKITEATPLSSGDIITIGKSSITIGIDAAETDYYKSTGTIKHEEKIPENAVPEEILGANQLQLFEKITDIIGFTKNKSAKSERFLDALEIAFPDADRRAILLLEGNNLKPYECWPRQDHHFSTTLSGWVIQQKAAQLWCRNTSDPKTKESEGLKDTRSAIYSPMVCEGIVSGVIHVDSKKSDTAFNINDVVLLGLVSNIFANALCVNPKKYKYDLFLSHNSLDKPVVEQLGAALINLGFSVWLDKWELRPGLDWQDALEEIIMTCRSAAVCFGGSGIGPWEDREMKRLLIRFVKERKDGKVLPIIPVLLPGAPDNVTFPLFLECFTWVDMRAGIDKKGLDRVQWGITGINPNSMANPHV